MHFFESLLTLGFIAVALLYVSSRVGAPYPSVLAISGVAVAFLPWAPEFGFDPQLALALFVAPALLDAAYDFHPKTLQRHWKDMLALAVFAVVLTTVAVGAIAHWYGGLPIAAAIALGALVAPPDAAAAAAMLGRLPVPRRAVAILQGESLLNDATALLIFTAAVGTQMGGSFSVSLILAAPAAILLGMVVAAIYTSLTRDLRDSLGGVLASFTVTFGLWVLAERLHVSAVLAVVAFAMTVASVLYRQQTARSRIHSYAVWTTAVFFLNVVAFLLMGFLARSIFAQLSPEEVWPSVRFAMSVLVVVVLVRMAWVLTYTWLRHHGRLAVGERLAQTKLAVVVGWCGMRGLVTMAAALSVPLQFPYREQIQLGALAVVLGTLVLQGLTLSPLVKLMRVAKDKSFEAEFGDARASVLEAAITRLELIDNEDAAKMAQHYRTELASAAIGKDEQSAARRELKLAAIGAMRQKLHELRGKAAIEDDIYHALEEELDWDELAASPRGRLAISDG